MDTPEIDQNRIELEREKWRDELRLREREVAIKEREQRSHEEELGFKIEEQKRSRWASPLVIAVLAAAVAASGNAIVAWLTAYEQQRADLRKAEQARSLDESKSEADRILEVIKTNNDPDKAATNLKFLLEAGLIQNPKTRGPLETYLKTRKPGEGVTLPAPAPPTATPPLLPPQVLGGTPVARTDWPWLVAVYMRASAICGGTALAPTIVLTSAHCVKGEEPKDFEVASPIEGSKSFIVQSRIPVARIIVHSGYSLSSSRHDIAILVLAAEIPPPFAMLSLQRSTDPPAGTLGMIAAFSLVQRQADTQVSALLQASLPIVDVARCSARYGERFDSASEICAGFEEGGVDACTGSGGGPLVAVDRKGQKYQVGIISWGEGCGRPGSYGVYTRISSHADWIRQFVPNPLMEAIEDAKF